MITLLYFHPLQVGTERLTGDEDGPQHLLALSRLIKEETLRNHILA